MKLPKPIRAVKQRRPIARKARVRKQKKSSRGKLGRLADKLFSLIVRSRGRCFAESGFTPSPCAGPLQCAHVVSRSYRSTRWDEENALCLCAGAHMYYTHHPLEWEQFIEWKWLSPERLAALKARALVKWDGDIDGVLVRLAARAVALGIKA